MQETVELETPVEAPAKKAQFAKVYDRTNIPIKAVLCDIDGTLIDLHMRLQAIKDTFKKMGLNPQLPDEELKKRTFGLKSVVYFRNIFPQRAADAEKFRDLMHQIIIADPRYTVLLPTVKETMDWFKKRGIKIGVITTGDRKIVNHILKVIRLPVDVAITADDVRNVKPHQEGVLLSCSKLGVRPQECIMIGDDIVDIEAGKNGGVQKTVGITTGKYKRDVLSTANPDFIIDKFSELVKIIEKM